MAEDLPIHSGKVTFIYVAFLHYFIGIISWPKIHIHYRGNSYRDIVDQNEWEGKWEGGGRSGRVRIN